MDLQAFLKPQVMPALEKTVVLSEKIILKNYSKESDR